jgi:hypothetical protein
VGNVLDDIEVKKQQYRWMVQKKKGNKYVHELAEINKHGDTSLENFVNVGQNPQEIVDFLKKKKTHLVHSNFNCRNNIWVIRITDKCGFSHSRLSAVTSHEFLTLKSHTDTHLYSKSLRNEDRTS